VPLKVFEEFVRNYAAILKVDDYNQLIDTVYKVELDIGVGVGLDESSEQHVNSGSLGLTG
jgi:hypothetical protein